TRLGSRGLIVRDRDYFQRAVADHTFSVGDFQVGKVSKVPVIGFSYPRYDADGKLLLVTYASITVSWLNAADAGFRSQLPRNSTVATLDPHSVVTAEQPDVGATGSSLQPELLKHLLGESGTFYATPADGLARIYAYYAVPNLPAPTRKVLVGIPV